MDKEKVKKEVKKDKVVKAKKSKIESMADVLDAITDVSAVLDRYKLKNEQVCQVLECILISSSISMSRDDFHELMIEFESACFKKREEVIDAMKHEFIEMKNKQNEALALQAGKKK